MKAEQEVELFILKKIGVSIQAINEAYDALTQSRDIILKYYALSSNYPPEMRKEINGLVIESDLLILEFNSLYLEFSELVEGLKQAYVSKKSPTKVIKEKKKTIERFLKLRKRLSKLIKKAEKTIKKVREYQEYPPLPIA